MTTRRLAAILAADVVGFSKLVGEDEAGTLAALREIRKEIVNPVLAEHGGRIFKLMGDGMLAEFPSAVSALRAAIGIQQGVLARNSGITGNGRIEVRIGVHQGDVVIEGTDLLGDGVNIARGWKVWQSPVAFASPDFFGAPKANSRSIDVNRIIPHAAPKTAMNVPASVDYLVSRGKERRCEGQAERVRRP
jgi:hypothetical protein